MARLVKDTLNRMWNAFRSRDEDDSTVDKTYVPPPSYFPNPPKVLGTPYHPRILVVGEPQKQILAKNSGRSKPNVSEELRDYLLHNHDRNFMLWNLSPSEGRHIDYSLFDHQVLEFPPYKIPVIEDLPSIMQLYCIIYTLEFWLNWDPDHVAVIFGGDDIRRTAFVVGSFLAYCQNLVATENVSVRQELMRFWNLRYPNQSVHESPNWRFLLEEMDFLYTLPMEPPKRHSLSVLIIQLPGPIASCKECPEVEIFRDGHEGGHRSFISREDCIPGRTIKWMSASLRVEVNQIIEGDIQIVVYSHVRISGEKDYEKYLEYEENVGETFDDLYQGVSSREDDDEVPSHPRRPIGLGRRAVMRFGFHTSSFQRSNTAITIQPDKMDILEPKLVDERGVAMYITLQDPPKELHSPMTSPTEMNLKGLDALYEGCVQITYHLPHTPHPNLVKQLVNEGFEPTVVVCALKCTGDHLRASRRILATGLLFKLGAIATLRNCSEAKRSCEENGMTAEEIYAARTLCYQRSAGVMLPAPTDEVGCQEVLSRRKRKSKGQSALETLGTAFFGDTSINENYNTPEKVCDARTQQNIFSEHGKNVNFGFDMGSLLKAIGESSVDQAARSKSSTKDQTDTGVNYADFLSNLIQWGEETHTPYIESDQRSHFVEETRNQANQWLSSTQPLVAQGNSDSQRPPPAEPKPLCHDKTEKSDFLSALLEDISASAVENPQKFHELMNALYGNDEDRIYTLQKVLVEYQSSKFSGKQGTELTPDRNSKESNPEVSRLTDIGTPLLSPSRRVRFLKTSGNAHKDSPPHRTLQDLQPSTFGPHHARDELEQLDKEARQATIRRSSRKSMQMSKHVSGDKGTSPDSVGNSRKAVQSLPARLFPLPKEETGEPNATLDDVDGGKVYLGEYDSESVDSEQSNEQSFEDDNDDNHRNENELISPEGDPRVSVLVQLNNRFRHGNNRQADEKQSSSTPILRQLQSATRNLNNDYSEDAASGEKVTSAATVKLNVDSSYIQSKNQNGYSREGATEQMDEERHDRGFMESSENLGIASERSLESVSLQPRNHMELSSDTFQSKQGALPRRQMKGSCGKMGQLERVQPKNLTGDRFMKGDDEGISGDHLVETDRQGPQPDGTVASPKPALAKALKSKFQTATANSGNENESIEEKLTKNASDSKATSKLTEPAVLKVANKDDTSKTEEPGETTVPAKKFDTEKSVQNQEKEQRTNNPLKDDEQYGKFFKMLKAGVPRPAVEQKMEFENLDTSVLDLDSEKPLSAQKLQERSDDGPALKDDPNYSKFFKMLKAGIPRPAVEQKMQMENLDTSVLDLDPEKSLSAQAKSDNGPALKDHPDYSTFFKMLKAGIPRPAVEQKMQMAGLNPDVLDLEPESPLPSNIRSNSKAEPKKAKSKKSQPKEKRKKIFWDPIPLERLSKRISLKRSIWGNKEPEASRESRTLSLLSDGTEDDYPSSPDKLSEDKDEGSQMQEACTLLGAIGRRASTFVDEQEFRSLFVKDEKQLQEEAEKKKKASSKENKEKAPQRISLIDGKRAMNVGIALSRLKLPHEIIQKALQELSLRAIVEYRENESSDPTSISYNDLGLLPEIMPDSDEISTVKGYLGDKSRLGEVERFFLAVADVPEPHQRAKALLVQLGLDSRVGEIREQLGIFSSACKEVKYSQCLKRILQIALLVGNKMNGIDDFTKTSEAKKATYAFTVGSLLKLAHTKAFDGKTTVLHFICKTLQRHYPQSLKLKEDFDNFYKVLNLSMDSIQQSIDLLESDVALMDRLVREQAKEIGSWAAVCISGSGSGETDPLRMPMAQYVWHAQQELKNMNRLIHKVQERFRKLKDYWGEDPDMTADEFFDSLNAFIQAFVKSKASLRKATKGRK